MKIKLIIITGSILGLIIINNAGLLPVADIGRSLTRPLANILTGSGQALGAKLREFKDLGNLTASNKQLEVQNQQLQEQLNDYQTLAAENQQLREQLGYLPSSRHETMGAEVIGFQPSGVRQLIRINRGQRDGIKNGMVVTHGQYVVGKIVTTGHSTSAVLVVNDPEFRVLVRSQTTDATGIVIGQSGGGLVMEKIPQTQTVDTNDIIVTSGLDGEFPPNLIIGRVSGINSGSTSIFKTAQLHNPIDIGSLRMINVIKSFNE